MYLVYGGDYDYAWFSKWDGDVVAYIGAETAGVRGLGIGIKVTQYGTRWVLLAGLAPELWTNMDHWSDDAKEILYRAISWAAVKAIGISITPVNVYVGDLITVEIPPLPGTIYSVLIDDTIVLRDILGKNESAIIRLKVPNLERGIHRVVVVSEGMYYGEAFFYVNTKLDILTKDPRAGGTLELSVTGHPVNTTLFVCIDDNIISNVRARDANPLRLTIAIPDYFEGIHVLNLRTEDGEVIASSNVFIGESAFKSEVLSYYNNMTYVLSQLLVMMNALSNYTSSSLRGVNESVSVLSSLTSSLIQSLDLYLKQTLQELQGLREVSTETSLSVNQSMTKLRDDVMNRVNELELRISGSIGLLTSLAAVLIIVNVMVLVIEALTRLRR